MRSELVERAGHVEPEAAARVHLENQRGISEREAAHTDLSLFTLFANDRFVITASLPCPIF